MHHLASFSERAMNSFFAKSLEVATPTFDATTSKKSVAGISIFFSFVTAGGGRLSHFSTPSANNDDVRPSVTRMIPKCRFISQLESGYGIVTCQHDIHAARSEET